MRDIDYGTFVRLIRAQRGQTQEEFARELEVTVGTINGWENGRHRPVRAQRTRLGRLAEELGVSPPSASTTGPAHIAGEREIEASKMGSVDVRAPQQKVEPIE